MILLRQHPKRNWAPNEGEALGPVDPCLNTSLGMNVTLYREYWVPGKTSDLPQRCGRKKTLKKRQPMRILKLNRPATLLQIATNFDARASTSIEVYKFLWLFRVHWCAKIKDEVEELAYQLNEEAERTEKPIRRLSKVMYGSTCADMQVDVMGECLSSIKHVVGARRNRRQTAGEIARHTTQATGRPISRFTVARRRHGGGLFARRPVRCVPLTPAHRRRRSLWCREHRNWRDNEWGRVLFTDESRFSLSSDSHRILIWRERGSRNHPSNITERDVWGGIMLGSRTDLHIFDAGSVNGTRYCNEILLPYVRLFRGAMGLQFLFMDDNAPCHRTVAAEELLES
ncbi:transposable element Tcb2 transposase [Trichonephila clavipes]|nr:transposable element Tcb2 transposase [Trichonephila clavipes]